MQVIPGSRVFSQFRHARLLDQLKTCEPVISGLHASYYYFIDIQQPLNVLQNSQLQSLLQYGHISPIHFDRANVIWAIPRIGTISPWSSKATEIIQRCGLEAIHRVERGICYQIECVDEQTLALQQESVLTSLLYDRMTQSLVSKNDLEQVFQHSKPAPLVVIPVVTEGLDALLQINQTLGLGLSQQEIDYLLESYLALGRNPTDAELVMFAQVNSEHCRHKIFNADWVIDGEKQPMTLFEMIRHTTNTSPGGVLSAYHDNAAVIEGALTENLMRDLHTGRYDYQQGHSHIVIKVETHNHPTAISPHPGAATGVGGEIRDEGATGRGSSSKAGLSGFSVSHLRIPEYPQPWEDDFGKPGHLASALDIMLEAPIGGAAFGNEFGRPNLAGYFRSFEQIDCQQPEKIRRGYLKPIMIAGGVGTIRANQIEKQEIPSGACIIVLGGPAMLIGLGGGAASSRTTGQGSEALDFASVQRENPEMQRRCQEVITACWSQAENNPILSIHDIGAGGLCNAVPELVHDAGRSGWFQLRDVPCADPGMSPMEIWCNEAQERFVLAVKPEDLARFTAICERERCLFAVIGESTVDQQLIVEDQQFQNRSVDLPMSLLFGKPPRMLRDTAHKQINQAEFQLKDIDFQDAVKRVLSFPAVADKSFLITIADRSVTGLVCRDQMVGPWQIPVADVAVTAAGFKSYAGEAMAMGERSPLAVNNAPASGRMAVAEAITNIMAANIQQLSDVKLSANWMAAANAVGEDAMLYDTVKAVGMELCPALGIAIPVGKDSLSMQTSWQQNGQDKSVVSPVSLVVTAYAPVQDVRKTLTPELRCLEQETVLILIDLGQGQNRLGGSVLAQVYGETGGAEPDLDSPDYLKQLFAAIQQLNQQSLLLASHDRSDGGLLATLCEMAFAARGGLQIELDAVGGDVQSALFSEELGVVIQVKQTELQTVLDVLAEHQLQACSHVIGKPVQQQTINFRWKDQQVLSESRSALQKIWSETSYRMQSLRDNPDCARQQYELIDADDPGLNVNLTFDPADTLLAPALLKTRPRVAILREQGVNGHVEMAA
ncbi:MAG: phosphoribosylformylglycinamidine synthase, partial [Methylococcales bacterium]